MSALTPRRCRTTDVGRLLAAAVALSAVAAACGASPVEPSEAAPAVCAAGQIDGDLRIHLADDVLPPRTTTDFSERFGVDVEMSSYGTTEELIAQVEARVGEYDVIIPDHATIGLLREADLLIPLSLEAIPGRSNLMPLFDDPPYDPGSAHSVPFRWGTVGMGVNVNVAGGLVPDTWGLIFDEQLSERFAGRISLIDDPRVALGAALSYLGHSMNSEDPDQISDAADLLAATRTRLGEFTSADDATSLVNGETDVAQGPAAAMFDAFAAADAWDDYTYVVPAEGAALTVDAMAVPITATHPCTAHTFIDFLLDPDRGAQVAAWNRSASPNEAASALLPPELRDDQGLYPPAATMAELEFIRDLDDESAYVDAFERARR